MHVIYQRIGQENYFGDTNFPSNWLQCNYDPQYCYQTSWWIKSNNSNTITSTKKSKSNQLLLLLNQNNSQTEQSCFHLAMHHEISLHHHQKKHQGTSQKVYWYRKLSMTFIVLNAWTISTLSCINDTSTISTLSGINDTTTLHLNLS